jgi:hypothetical protein
MPRLVVPSLVDALVFTFWMALAAAAFADPVPVRHREGLTHGLLTVSAPSGELIGEGKYLCTTDGDGDRATTRLLLRLRDGSVHDERLTFDQARAFTLVNYHLKQSGPSFAYAIEAEIAAPAAGSGRRRVKVSKAGKDGRRETTTDEEIELPSDLANGLLPVLVKNLPEGRGAELHLLAFRPEPKLVRLELAPEGKDPVTIAGEKRQAVRFRGHFHLGALLGTLARVADKEPPDLYFWALGGDHPAYLRSRTPLFVDGPIWQIDLASPAWPEEKQAVAGAATGR